MLLVIALGGNALLRRGEPLTAENQRENVRMAAEAIAAVSAAGHQLVITHGNGPQVGLLALQGAAYNADNAFPLDVLGAETEGMIGYLIEQELENSLAGWRQVATLLTQVEVDPEDPAFKAPSKPVGPVYSKADIEHLAASRGWSYAPDGDWFRRVVASPAPRAIPDLNIIRLLLSHDVIVICAGGGGIPVARRSDGSLIGVEAVIDKDRASAMLARDLDADGLIMLTDVDAVYRDWATPEQSAIDKITPGELSALEFASGSMGPKVEAACSFVCATGRFAGIGTLSDATEIIEGKAGTVVCSSKT